MGSQRKDPMGTDGQTTPNGTTFYRNTSCAYFPCHAGVAPGRFNCLFCYCPLYTLGEACGGNFSYTAKGVKDCTACTVLHDGDDGAEIVRARFPELARMASLAKGGEAS